MLRMRYDKFQGEESRERLNDIICAAEQSRRLQGNRYALDALIHSVGTEISHVFNESYCAQALDFHLGVLLALAGQPEKADELISRSGVLPDAGGQKLFSDVVSDSLKIDAAMESARLNGAPSILVASMPRSASATFTQTLAGTLGLALVRLSIGVFPDFYLMRSFVNRFSPGGAITHDHFSGNAHNLGVLRDCGLRDVLVLVRDPRASAASFVNMMRKISDGDAMDKAHLEATIISAALRKWIPWLNSWLDAERNGKLGIRWINSRDIRGPESTSVYHSIITNLSERFPAVAKFKARPIASVEANMVRGDDNAWRESVSKEGQELLWRALPARAIELMALER